MGKLDLIGNVTEQQVIDPVVVTADANGETVDLAEYNDVAFYVLVGESGDTLSGSVKIELEIQDSPDDSAWTAAADADIIGAVTGTNVGTFAVIDAAAEDDVVASTRYTGNERYCRCVVNVTGTHTNGTPIGAVAMKSGSNYRPV